MARSGTAVNKKQVVSPTAAAAQSSTEFVTVPLASLGTGGTGPATVKLTVAQVQQLAPPLISTVATEPAIPTIPPSVVQTSVPVIPGITTIPTDSDGSLPTVIAPAIVLAPSSPVTPVTSGVATGAPSTAPAAITFPNPNASNLAEAVDPGNFAPADDTEDPSPTAGTLTFTAVTPGAGSSSGSVTIPGGTSTPVSEAPVTSTSSNTIVMALVGLIVLWMVFK